LGHHRHWNLERGFREAGASCGLKVHATPTSPPGGHFSVVRAGRFLLARSRILNVGASIRPRKFTRDLARLNSFLEPYQKDLFEPDVELQSDTIFGLLVTLAPRPWQDQTKPAYVGLRVPSSGLRGWHFQMSLEDLQAQYGSHVESVPDRAIPALKAEFVRGSKNQKH
jgi:hypothetical protein